MTVDATPAPEFTRLHALADHLDSDLAYSLRRLIAASGQAYRFLEVQRAAERNADLAAELRRQVTYLADALERERKRATRDAGRAVVDADALRTVYDAAVKADHGNLLGKCDDHAEDDRCTVCTALGAVEAALYDAQVAVPALLAYRARGGGR